MAIDDSPENWKEVRESLNFVKADERLAELVKKCFWIR